MLRPIATNTTFQLTEQRRRLRTRLSEERFDLAIIGGGITGASIARDAALRGYRVALVEQADFAFGTSSRSSRLVHGGLRYLEHGQIGLVFESVSERARLADLARHIVRPLPFVFPVFRRQGRRLWMVDSGLWLYDALALFRNFRTHETLSPRGVTDHLPGIRSSGLTGGVLYYDYQTDDARLVLENIISARAAGATILSYAQMTGFEYDGQRVSGLEVHDLIDDESFTLSARTVVCAAGPWTDPVMGLSKKTKHWLNPTKGVHLVVPRDKLPLDKALVMRHPQDKRVHFALPYHERTVLGTTDTFHEGDPAKVRATRDDVRYLLLSANDYFPGANLQEEDVISSWAGLRPLLAQEDLDDPSAVSREHVIESRSDGVVVIAGGKLTTYRRMAAECMEEVVTAIAAGGGPAPKKTAPTHRMPLPGAEGLRTDSALDDLAARLARRFGSRETGQHLAEVYGSRSQSIVDLVNADPKLASCIIEGLPHVWAEILFSARHELVCTLTDLMVRRTQLFYRDLDQGLGVAQEIAERIAPILDWDAAETDRQVEAYREEVADNRHWRTES
jgi:glycerol-3-phosphate dehydrogenase